MRRLSLFVPLFGLACAPTPAGSWEGSCTIADVPLPIPVTLDLEKADDGTYDGTLSISDPTGTVSVNADVSGDYDAETGDLALAGTATYDGQEFEAVVDAQLDKDELTAELTSVFLASCSLEREK
jgi:hypothetical protein